MRRPRAPRSLVLPIGWALACASEPPVFPDAEPSTSGGTMADGDDAGSSSVGPPDGSGGQGTGGSTTATDSTTGDDGPPDGDTSTGTLPPPQCRDPDGLCHAPIDIVPLSAAPTAIDAGDIDGDGVMDLAVTDAQDELAAFIGLGDGTFAPPQWTPLSPSDGASSLVLAMLDDDPRLDVAVAFSGDEEVGVLLGDGEGGFQPTEPIAAGQNALWVVDGDLDADGVVDLAVAEQSDLHIGLFRGLAGSGGQFAALPGVLLGFRPSSLVVTPALGGGLGLVVTSRPDNQIALLAKEGDTALMPVAQLAVGGNPVHADIADVDGDGLLDVVSVHRGNNSLAIRLGVADLQWAPPLEYAVIAGPQDAALVDMNLDGFLDVVACGDGQEGVAIVQGVGDGTFAPPVLYPSILNQSRLVVADLNGDGVPDVASIGQPPGGIFIVLSHA